MAEISNFDKFWAAYPRKVARVYAKECWQRRKPDTRLPIDEIIISIERHKLLGEWKRGYIPNPSTFINQGRYLDEGLPRLPKDERLDNAIAWREKKRAEYKPYLLGFTNDQLDIKMRERYYENLRWLIKEIKQERLSDEKTGDVN